MSRRADGPVDGVPDDDVPHDVVERHFAAMRAPGTDDELAGLDAAVEAFRAERRPVAPVPVRRSGRVVRNVGIAAAVITLSTAGLAAAGAGLLPNPLASDGGSITTASPRSSAPGDASTTLAPGAPTTPPRNAPAATDAEVRDLCERHRDPARGRDVDTRIGEVAAQRGVSPDELCRAFAAQSEATTTSGSSTPGASVPAVTTGTEAPGKSGNAPGQTGNPGNSGNAPGQTGNPGNSGNAPGQTGNPGNSGNAPGQTGNPGNSGNPPGHPKPNP